MSEINLTKAVRQNLLSLQNTAKLMAGTQDRLATGNKVNTALDNPSNYFTSASLMSRSGELESLLDSMNAGVKTLEAADNGLTSITKTLESMQSTLRQARQDKTFETKSYTLGYDPAGAQQITFSGGAFTGSTNFALTSTGSGQYKETTAAYAAPAVASKSEILGSANLSAAAVTGGSMDITYKGQTVTVTVGTYAGAVDHRAQIKADIENGLSGTALAGLIDVDITSVGGFVDLRAANNEDGVITVADGAATDEILGPAVGVRTGSTGSDAAKQFTVNGKTINLTTADTPVATAVTTINTQLQAAGLKFEAYANGAALGIRATATDSGSLSIGGKDAADFGVPSSQGIVSGLQNATLTLVKTLDEMVAQINSDATLKTKVKASNDNGKLRIQNLSTKDLSLVGVNSSGKLTGKITDTDAIDGNSVRSGLSEQFNTLRDQLDKLADDASFNGINLLRGDKLKITFNETGTSSIDIQVKDGKSVDTTELGLPTTLLAEDLDADDNIDALLAKVKLAINTVRSQASTFGSNLSVVENRQNFTKNMMNTLQSGASDLTLADMNEEAANMVALQTRQSLATSSLSMANQADQGVLQLLR